MADSGDDRAQVDPAQILQQVMSDAAYAFFMPR
jgi:hypothetical protein